MAMTKQGWHSLRAVESFCGGGEQLCCQAPNVSSQSEIAVGLVQLLPQPSVDTFPCQF